MKSFKTFLESRGHSIIANKLKSMEYLRTGVIAKKEKPAVDKARAELDKEIHKRVGKSEDEKNESIEHEHMMHHMADKDYNVVAVKKMTMGGHTAHHVEVNNLPTNKNGHVEEADFHKAQKHLDKLGSDYELHTKQKINSTVGGV